MELSLDNLEKKQEEEMEKIWLCKKDALIFFFSFLFISRQVHFPRKNFHQTNSKKSDIFHLLEISPKGQDCASSKFFEIQEFESGLPNRGGDELKEKYFYSGKLVHS